MGRSFVIISLSKQVACLHVGAGHGSGSSGAELQQADGFGPALLPEADRRVHGGMRTEAAPPQQPQYQRLPVHEPRSCAGAGSLQCCFITSHQSTSMSRSLE